MGRVLGVVDGRPGVAGAEVVGEAVMVGKAVVFALLSVDDGWMRWYGDLPGFEKMGDGPYSMPYLSISSAPSWLASHH